MTARKVIGVTVTGTSAVVSGHDSLMVLSYANVRHRRHSRGWAIKAEAVPDVEAAGQVLGVHVSIGKPS